MLIQRPEQSGMYAPRPVIHAETRTVARLPGKPIRKNRNEGHAVVEDRGLTSLPVNTASARAPGRRVTTGTPRTSGPNIVERFRSATVPLPSVM